MRSDLAADVRYALRSLARTPVWTTMLMVTIAVGIGSAAAMQGFVRGLLTTDLPIFAIERVIAVFAIDTTGTAGPVPFDVFTRLKARSDVFESLAAIRESQQRASFDAATRLVSVAAYTPDAPSLFPIPSGREGVTLGPGVRFAIFPASLDPAGRSVHVEGSKRTIAGAMPYWFEGLYRGRAIDLWIPIDAGDRDDGPVWLIGRLRPEVSRATAQSAIDEIATTAGGALVVIPYTGQTPETASGMQRVGALLEMASIILFAIAGANVAAFMLARSWARARETAVRVAIGARRRQLLRHLLIDSAVIACAGGVAGFILAWWMAGIVPLMFFDQDAERLVFSPDARGILTTSVAGILLIAGCGLVPLFEIRDDVPSAVLQREAGGPSRAMMHVNTALILVQMAGCALLVISTGLVWQGFQAALDTDAGRRLGNPIVITLEALPSPSPDEGRRYFAASLAAAASVADVSETVWAARLPGVRPVWQWVRFDPPQRERRPITLPIAPLTPPILNQLRLPPISGRLFATYNAGCRTIAMNEMASRAIFYGHPIGRLVETDAGPSLEVIAVTRAKTADQDVTPMLYDHPLAAVPLGIDGRLTLLAPSAAELGSGLIDVNIVSANYFDAFGAALTAGKLFEGGGCRVGVVNEEAASRYFGGNALGGAVIDGNGRRTEIVGVVRTSLLNSAQRLQEPTMFLPATQDFLPRMTAVLSADAVARRRLDTIHSRISQVEGGLADRLVVTTLADHLSATALASERIAATLIGTLSVIAVAVGAIGLYGLMADRARRRQREFAMRLALGAQGWRVVRLVIAEGMRLVIIGALAGMLGSVLVSRWLSAIVPAAGWPSLLVWAAAPAVLAAAVVVASVIPARRALSVDLVSLMRDM